MNEHRLSEFGKGKRILVCAESLRINETSSGIVTATFIAMSQQTGFVVDVLSQKNFNYEVTWLSGVKLHLFEPIETSGNLLRRIPKVRAIFPLMEKVRPMFNPLIKQWKDEIEKALQHQPYDLIISLGSGSLFYPHFALASLKPSVNWIANFHDPFPMHTYPVPYKHKKGIRGWFLQRKVHEIMQLAWKVSFPSEYLRKSMLQYYPEIAAKSFVIPHIGTHLPNLPVLPEDGQLQLQKGKINIVHAGTLLGPRNPAFLLKAIEQLHRENAALSSQVNFVFIGKVSRELKAAVAASSLANVVFFDGRISYGRSLEIIQEANALMVIEAINDFSPFMPGKLADICYYEKPVLALTCMNSEVMRLLGNDYPYYAPLNDAEKIKAALVQMVHDLQSAAVNMKSVKAIKKYCSVEENGKLISNVLQDAR